MKGLRDNGAQTWDEIECRIWIVHFSDSCLDGGFLTWASWYSVMRLETGNPWRVARRLSFSFLVQVSWKTGISAFSITRLLPQGIDVSGFSLVVCGSPLCDA